MTRKSENRGIARKRSLFRSQLFNPGLYVLQLGFEALSHLLQICHLHFERGGSCLTGSKGDTRHHGPEANASALAAASTSSAASASAKGPSKARVEVSWGIEPRTVSHSPAGSGSKSRRSSSISTWHISFTSFSLFEDGRGALLRARPNKSLMRSNI